MQVSLTGKVEQLAQVAAKHGGYQDVTSYIADLIEADAPASVLSSGFRLSPCDEQKLQESIAQAERGDLLDGPEAMRALIAGIQDAP